MVSKNVSHMVTSEVAAASSNRYCMSIGVHTFLIVTECGLIYSDQLILLNIR